MLGQHGRGVTRAIFTAPARGLAALGVRPNHVTIVGTATTVVLSFTMLATGHWAAGAIALGVVLFADSLDGTLARLTGSTSTFGSFLDSTLDRLGDAAVFGALVFSIATETMPRARSVPDWMVTWLLVTMIATLAGAAAVPYARAKAESLGISATVGIAERTDRLVITLVAAGFYGFGLTVWLPLVAFTWVALASWITVAQRIAVVKRSLDATDTTPTENATVATVTPGRGASS